MDKSAASLELFNFIFRFCSNTALSIKLLFTITGSYRNCTLFINFFYMLFFSSSLSTKLFYNYLTMLMFEDCKLYTCPYCLLHVWLWQFKLINFSLYFFGLWFMHYECTVFWNTKKIYTQSIYSKNNSYLSNNFLSIWMTKQKYFIAFRIIQIHKII